jgi:hypothetical protein
MSSLPSGNGLDSKKPGGVLDLIGKNFISRLVLLQGILCSTLIAGQPRRDVRR